MSEHIVCPRCQGRVGVPATPTENVTCPFCKQFLMAIDRRTGATWEPKRGAPRWLRSAGIALVLLGIGGFSRTLWVEDHRSGRQRGPTLMAALMNPLFFVGLPVGAYCAARKRAY